MMMYVHDDLPKDVRRMARDDMHAMVLHLVNHDYRLTERGGHKTRYGDRDASGGDGWRAV